MTMQTVAARHDSDKRVIRTKKAIRAALFKLLETKDLSAVTITELTQKANVNRRTFYTHYKNITEILKEIEGELEESLKLLIQQFDISDYRESTYRLFIGLNELITNEFEFYFHLVRSDMRGTLTTKLKNVVRCTAEKALEQYCSKNSEEFKMISSFIVGGFINAYLEWHDKMTGISIEHAAKLAGSMVSLCMDNTAGEYRQSSSQAVSRDKI